MEENKKNSAISGARFNLKSMSSKYPVIRALLSEYTHIHNRKPHQLIVDKKYMRLAASLFYITEKFEVLKFE